jgi:spermidine/putrescine transport system permease protein
VTTVVAPPPETVAAEPAQPKGRLRRRRPFVLAGITWAYVAWSLLPVLIAIQFSFNDGRSRTTWQGASFRWYWGDQYASVFHNDELRLALTNTVRLGLLTVLIATPLGTALAVGLTRWRGRGSATANSVMLLPLATPEIVMGSALFLVFTNLYTAIPLGRTAQVLGHVTFSMSYVVVIVRARLVSIGSEYETAARDLGASPLQALRTILIPLLAPSVFAGAMVVLASSMDDFVVSSFLQNGYSSTTVPIELYTSSRSSPTPALNALATLLLLATAIAAALAWLVARRLRQADGSTADNLPVLDL